CSGLIAVPVEAKVLAAKVVPTASRSGSFTLRAYSQFSTRPTLDEAGDFRDRDDGPFFLPEPAAAYKGGRVECNCVFTLVAGDPVAEVRLEIWAGPDRDMLARVDWVPCRDTGIGGVGLDVTANLT